jgi:hypothetical protein
MGRTPDEQPGVTDAAPTRLGAVRRKSALLALALTLLWNFAGYAADDGEGTDAPMLPLGKWLDERGPFDPRPYNDTVFGDGLLNRRYFERKNHLRVEKGISLGGYFSWNFQWGSEGGPTHGISETLILLTWEPVRDADSAGRWALAGRYSRSFERLSADYRELASLGLLWVVPFGRPQDIAGLGFFAGDPSDASRGLESGAEIFYRLQLTQAVSVMPDLQCWSRDDRDGEYARSWVWGLRAEFQS